MSVETIYLTETKSTERSTTTEEITTELGFFYVHTKKID